MKKIHLRYIHIQGTEEYSGKPISEPEQSGSPAATFQKNRIWEKSS